MFRFKCLLQQHADQPCQLIIDEHGIALEDAVDGVGCTIGIPG